MTRLINPRGRIVTVDEKEVVDLLKRGFLHVPPDQENLDYNQVYDKGPGYEDPIIDTSETVKRFIPKHGDVLETEIV